MTGPLPGGENPDGNDAVGEADALLDEAEHHRLAGRLGQALAAGECAVSSLQAAYGGDHPDVANALLGLGRTHEARNAYAPAEDAYRKANRIMERWGDEHQEVVQRIRVQARIALGQIYRIRGRLDEAHRTLRGAVELAEAQLGPDDADLVAALNALGIVCKYAGRWSEGEAAYRSALAIIAATTGPGSDDAATIWHNLGGLAFDARDYERAEAPARRAVEIREQILRPDHPAVAADVAALAAVVDALGRTDEAEALYRRALSIFEGAEGAEYDLAVLHNNLGVAAAERGDGAAAQGHYQSALALKEELLGPDHPDVAMTLHNLGVLEGGAGRTEQARALLRRALTIFRASLDSDHPKIADCETALRDLGLGPHPDDDAVA